MARPPLVHTPSAHQLSVNLYRGPPMEGEEPSRRVGVKSRRSRSFSVLLGGYPGISQGPSRRLGETEDEEGEESGEEEGYEDNEVQGALEGAPEAPEVPNIALSNQSLFSQAEPNFLKMMEKMLQLMGQMT
ncbi:hypothetical protein O181_036261 [Austropuccinia psidii MF-1]|uniref:Uncharacterized protein n=1 Tax=Austropuccinia psidii MF-1 TaxID=1389203 RepID=A0A9Q3D432_9BASI|nr:hypothetical protein [Austropuccinia psidii MF-1]